MNPGHYELPDETVAENILAYVPLILTAIDAALYPAAFVEEDQDRVHGEMEDLKAWFMTQFEG
jgi:hypothetical protein